MEGGIAKGYMQLAGVLKTREAKSESLARLEFSRNRLLTLLTDELPNLFDSNSFPNEAWTAEEQESAFRLKLGPEKWSRMKWTPRARRAWKLLDELFPVVRVRLPH